MQEQIMEGKVLRLEYRIYSVNGIVKHTETRSETEVSGSVGGGGGAMYGGVGFAAPVTGKVSSKTKRFQTIFITTDDGRDYTIGLDGFLAPCIQGQRITALFFIRGKESSGSCFAAHNHNSRETYTHLYEIKNQMFPKKGWKRTLVGISFLLSVAVMVFSKDGGMLSNSPGAQVLALVLMTLFLVFPIGFLFLIPASILMSVRMSSFKKNKIWKDYLANLR